MGVSPYVNRIYNDLTSGLIIFQLYDIIKPGTVDWKRVIKKFNKMRIMMEKIGQFVPRFMCFICLVFVSTHHKYTTVRIIVYLILIFCYLICSLLM